MNQTWIPELIGYAASVLVAISLMMSSILRLRVINLAGAVTFTIYGLLIDAYPVAAVNLLIVFVNLYYLRKIFASTEFFRLLEVDADSEYLDYFLNFYRDQIRRFFPGFSSAPADSRLRLFILRDLVPAGLLVGEVRGRQLWLELDFVIPQYRDLKVGRYLFDQRADFFRSRGVGEIVAEAATAEHAGYLRKVGFVTGEPGGTYRLPLNDPHPVQGGDER